MGLMLLRRWASKTFGKMRRKKPVPMPTAPTEIPFWERQIHAEFLKAMQMSKDNKRYLVPVEKGGRVSSYISFEVDERNRIKQDSLLDDHGNSINPIEAEPFLKKFLDFKN